MTDELVFYTNPMSRGRIVRWMLEEVGRPYRTELLDFGPAMKEPAYRAINPMGKVPALRHRGTTVTEAAAICTYLADVFPEAGLAPAVGGQERGPYYRWMFFAAGPLEQAATNKSMGFQVPPDREGMMGCGNLAIATDVIEGAVSRGPYILGEKFSAADVYVGSHIGWGMQFGTIDKRPAFEDYWQRISSRPAALKARKIDDDLLAAKQTASPPV